MLDFIGKAISSILDFFSMITGFITDLFGYFGKLLEWFSHLPEYITTAFSIGPMLPLAGLFLLFFVLCIVIRLLELFP